MRPGRILAVGALYCALSVAAGAFGAHGLEDRLSAEDLALWETAARYLIYAGFGLVAVGLAGESISPVAASRAAILLALGGGVFSGTVFLLALDSPRWLGAITPLGGLSMIFGFVVLAAAGWRR